MKTLIYSGNIEIQLQGYPALSFVEKNDRSASFNVIGFSTAVQIIDFRKSILEAVETVLQDGDLLGFAPKFNQPAQAEIWEDQEARLVIELHDPHASMANRYMLWIAVGIDNEAPVYNYLYEKWESLNDKLYAFVSVYQRPYAKHYLADGVELPSVSANT